MGREVEGRLVAFKAFIKRTAGRPTEEGVTLTKMNRRSPLRW